MRPLESCQLPLSPQQTVADAYAAQLLGDLGAVVAAPDIGNAEDAALAWAESGLMFLCGELNQPPRQGPGAIPCCARGVLNALRALAPQAIAADIDGARLLCERAALLGLRARGSVSANQSCRLLPTRDGWLALNLARRDDWALMAAWLQTQGPLEDWDSVSRAVSQRNAGELVERGRLLGLPAAAVNPPAQAARPWFRIHRHGLQRRTTTVTTAPLVIDLSSLWAGPLCSHLLQQSGARVIKVESLQRPDGARPGQLGPDKGQAESRPGSADFYHLLNAGKASVALDLLSPAGVFQLQELLRHADIVIEGSRPRALQQLGIDAEAMVRSKPGLVWLAISGYGRSEPQANWVAFGDDAAMAAGIVVAGERSPLFVGDALADPLCGLHGALLALAFWRAGNGALLDISLHDVAAHCLAYGPSIPRGTVVAGRGQQWWFETPGYSVKIAKPSARNAAQLAASLGSNTKSVLREFAIPC